MLKQIKILLLILSCLLLAGCSIFCIYRPTINQGNILCDDAIAQLRPGMTTDQVLYLMGTPILTNTFQPNRWDYVWTYKKGGNPRVQRHVTLYFAGDTLQNIQVTPWVSVS